MAKKQKEDDGKILVQGPIDRESSKPRQVYLMPEVKEILDKHFKYNSISTLINYIILDFDRRVDLRKEKIVNVYELRKYLDKKE